MEVKPNAFTIPKRSVLSDIKPPRSTKKPGHSWESIPIVNQKMSKDYHLERFKKLKADI